MSSYRHPKKSDAAAVAGAFVDDDAADDLAHHREHGPGSPLRGSEHGKRQDADEEVLLPRPSTTATEAAPAASDTTTLPLVQSAGLALIYMGTSMVYYLIIRHTKQRNMQYNKAFIVFGIEMTKLTVSVALKYREDGEFLPATVLLSPQRRAIWRGGLPYAVPSLLYAVYNNMTFYNLHLFHAGTYQVFMQTRILFTGILFSVLLRQALTLRKWGALVLLMVGVASKYYSPGALQLDGYVIFMLLQALLSSTAGVYNEYALKKDRHLSIHQQNFFMYLYALVFNAVFGVLADPTILTRVFAAATATTTTVDPLAEGEAAAAAAPISASLVVTLILLGASTGLSAAFILKFINVIVKAFASAVEVLLTAVAAAAVLGEAMTGYDLLAACIVMSSVYIYYTRGWGDHRTISLRPSTK
ncbi:Nucleotide-sugar transporter [Novymonas esmeraldas]|uniref:Nucleotide-sugar transporter n=1 Tax=Novymonas esmeraldas TaxID=1808958 RepID=A0AAW0ERE3_9TRYP